MECSCSIDIYHDGGPSFHKEKIVKARVAHVCDECFKKIQPGEKYEYVFGSWDGETQTYHTCLDCKSLRDVFFTSFVYTQVWNYFQDGCGYADSVIPESCISKLTPKAREKVCYIIESGWE